MQYTHIFNTVKDIVGRRAVLRFAVLRLINGEGHYYRSRGIWGDYPGLCHGVLGTLAFTPGTMNHNIIVRRQRRGRVVSPWCANVGSGGACNVVLVQTLPPCNLYSVRFQVRSLIWMARGDVMRWRYLVLMVAVLAMVLALAGCTSAGQSAGDQGQASQEKASQEQPKKEAGEKQEPAKKMTDEAKSKQVAPKKGTEQDVGSGKNLVEPPGKKRLKLTVPAMKRINNDPIPTGLGTDEQLFHDYAGVHLNSTGFPWKKTANVYIAGHRIGFPGTRSNLAFYDLEDLKNGDKVYLEDADGRKYTYVVYKKLIVEPTNLDVLNPIEGKNIISLQTCTLPDYTKHIIYREELQDIETPDDKSGDDKSGDDKSGDDQS